MPLLELADRAIFSEFVFYVQWDFKCAWECGTLCFILPSIELLDPFVLNVMSHWILTVPRNVVLCALFYLHFNCWTHHHYLETRGGREGQRKPATVGVWGVWTGKLAANSASACSTPFPPSFLPCRNTVTPTTKIHPEKNHSFSR